MSASHCEDITKDVDKLLPSTSTHLYCEVSVFVDIAKLINPSSVKNCLVKAASNSLPSASKSPLKVKA